jgi:hypothetical protein
MQLARFPRPLAALLPALLIVASCGKDDPKPVARDKANVRVYHAAAAANVAVTAFVTDQQVAQLTYGQTSGYQSVDAGSPTVRVNNGNQVVTSQALAFAKDQNYSVFLYSPAASIGSAALLSVADDLTAPVAGQAKVRVVHLAVGAPSPVRLTAPSPVPGSIGTDISPDVAFGTASGFFALNAGATNLTITTTGSSRTQVLAVGDGTGTGTGTKNYESGKIYTIVVRGIAGAGVPAAQAPQAVIVQNN